MEITEDTDNDGLISKAELDGDVNVTISLTGTGAVKGDTLTVNGTAIELTQAHIDAGEVLTTVDAPAEGATLTVDATITDAAGNVSEKGTDSAKLDTTAAGAPGVEITEDTDNDGLISKAELDGDVNVTISLTGTGAVKGDTLTVNGTAIELTQAHIDAGEVLTTVDAPAEGATLTVDATITDAAGNVSEKGTDSAKLDTTAAGAPGVEITEDTDNDGLISKAELDGDVNVTISLTGTGAVKGDTLTVNGTAIELTQAHIDAGEVLTTVDAPAEGATLTVDATITDAAGNVSEKGTDSAKLDTTAAGAPGVEITEDTDNDGLISKAELDGDVNVTISLTGTGAVKGDTLTVNGTAIELTQAHIDAGEVLTTVDAPAEGATLTVDATITDAAGNVSEKGTDSAKLDTTAAGAPGVEITEDTDNDGLISKAELDGDVNVTISLTGTGAVKGDTLTVNGTAIELTQAHIDAGEVLTTVDAPAEGATLTVDATITDAAGNVSEKGTDSAKLDTTAAGAPGVEITEDTDNDGLISKAELDGDVNVTISLTGTGAVKGDTLTVNGTAIELTQAHIDAGEVLTTVDAPAEGATLTVDATITDAAGNVSEKGTDSAKLDTTAAGAPGVEITEDTDNDGLISKAELDGDVNVTISLTGTGAVKGDTLTVNGTAIELTQAHIDAGEVLTTVDAPAEGATLTVDATITDAAGNVSEKGTDSAKLDTTAAGAPGVEITEDTDNDGLISKAELDGDVNVTISLTGTGAVKGDTLTVNGTAIELTQAHIDAGEVLTTVDAPAEGATLTVDATITDAAGNVSEKGTDSAKLDTTAAGAPGVEITEDTDNDGLISKAELDGDVNVTISLTGTGAVKGDTLTVNGTAIELTQAHIDAGEVLTTVDAPAEGATLTVDATITDAAGNVSEKGTDSAKLDTTAAGAPGVEITEDTDNDGLISKAELDGDVNVTISLTGTGAVKGDTLTVNGTAIELTQAHIDAGEVLTTVDAPAEGATLTVDATITDAAGNVSEKGTDSAKLDTTAAGAPGVEITEDTDNDGLISKAELDGDVNVTISLTGTGAVKGDTLTVNGTAIELTQAHIDAGEVLTTVDAPAEGATLTVDATITDAAGNVSEKGTDSAKLDTTAAGAPGVEITEDTDNDGLISKAELDGDVNVTISLTGTGAVKGDTLTVNGTAIELTQAHIDAGEVLTTVDAPAEGATLTVDATITDAAGNVSEKGTDSAKLDTTAAGAPGVEITEDTDNDGLISKAELDGDVNVTISLTGTGAVKGDTLTVNGTAIELTQAHIDAGEVLTTVDAPAEGATLTVDATITDAAGNVSEKGTDSAKLDTAVLTHPTDDGKAAITSDITDATNSGLKTDTITNDNTPDITGVTEAGATVTITYTDATDTVRTATGTADANGVYTIAITNELKDGANSLSIAVTDTAGNEATTTQDVTVDTSHPTISIDADLAGDDVINASEKGQALTISGTTTNVENGQLVSVTIDGKTYTGEVQGNVWSIVVPAADVANFEEGLEGITADVSDVAGNAATQATSSIEVDATVAKPTITNITDDSENSDYSEVTLHGTGSEAGNTIEVFAKNEDGDYVSIGTATVQNDLSWTLDISDISATPTNDNEFMFAKETDPAGNVSEASDTVHYYHGTYDPAVTEASDDYVLLGGGNDELRMVSDDDNDYFVADGGAHHDRAVFTGNIDEYQISINSNGEIVIYEPTEKDTNVFREFESFKFDEEVYTVEDLLKPEVTITSDTNNDEVLAGSEIGQNIAYQIDLPKGATVGTVLLVTLPSGVQSITLSEQQITSGKVEGSYVTPAEGSDFEVSVSITYPDGSQYGSTDTVHVNEGPEVNDFSVSSTSSVFDVPFSSHATDTEDDVDSSKTTSIVITSLPEFGTLYVINDDGSRTDLSVGSKVDDTSNIKYELDGNVNADFSFDATDYHGDTPINDLTEIALESGLVITGGSIADDGSLIQGTLNYHSAVNENGIGVNGNEVESDSKEYISIDFGDGTNVTEANISLGSLHDHYTDTDLGIDAKVHIELYKDGVLQKTVIVDSSSDIENSQYVANLQLDSGFDEVRLTTTAGQNSNFTLSNIEVVDSEINDEIEYKAVDSDGQESDDTAVVDITIPSSESALERAPVVNGDADLGNSAEDNAFVIDAAKLQLLLNTATDENQDDLFISALSVDESKGELVVTTNSHGQVTGAVFHPNENMSADDIKFDFTVSDGKLTDTGSAYLDVTPVADAPEVNVSLTGSPTHVYSEFPTFGMTYEDFLPENFDGTEFGIENTQIIDVWGERSGTSKRDYVFGEFDNGASYSISGGDGNDILVGAKDSKNDIRGDLGDDILVAGNGTDALYGSNHYDPNAKDVAILKGNSTDYEISKGSGFTSNDRWFNFSEDGANEVNSLHLHNIKYVQFEDGIFELDPDTGSLTKVEPTSSEYPLNIEASLTDVDGSETLTEIEISGLAQGDVLKDASGAVIGTASSDGTITLSGLWSSDATSVTLSGLTLVTTATNAAEISVTATSQEGSDTANTASGDDSIVLSDFAGVTMSGDGQSNTTGDTHDTIIGDTTGTVVTHGQDYNIAFMVDTSGSVGSSNIDDIEDQLEEVFDSLINSAKGEHSGTVNVMLVDFDTLAHTSVSVDLADAGAKDKLETVLDSLKSGGGTNYEDAFTVTNNWFETVKTTHPEANNMAYFITDGRPTYYNTDVTNPVVYNRPGNSNDRTLDDILNNADYVPGQTYSYAGKTIIDTHGKVYSYTSGYHYGTFQGFMRPDGTGKHEFVQIAGRGSYADSATLSQAELGFEMLESNGVTVEAIGIGSGLNEDQLKDFDSDGNVQTNVDADDLAEAILGTSEDKLPGADTISAGRGDDILFGDSMHMSGVSAQGYEGIKEYVAGKLNVAEVSDAQVHNYITENIGEFNQSTDNDKADHLHGNEGDDIIFGQGGNDYLYGGDDNDTLIGGLGSDILTGGDDSDVFKWVNSDLDGSTDSITDFHINEGDKLDLSDLFTDLSENEVSSMLDQIKGTVNGDDDHSSITVDRDGSSVTIDFEGVSATDLTNNLSTILLIKDD
ncbi:Ig-like domain-containing protein [Vibrio penaeicida]|uniref:Ig-like domain-containing protein n=2 Tax=Vibrio penaeicida TaxID=104609 RepID=UPI001CC507B9|nr:Ig-like domain-containing protein [Vibrio penaeicida]